MSVCVLDITGTGRKHVGANEAEALKAPPEAHVGGCLLVLFLHNSPSNPQKVKVRGFFFFPLNLGWSVFPRDIRSSRMATEQLLIPLQLPITYMVRKF